MKLDTLHKYMLQEALRNAWGVLREVKKKHRKGKDKENMQILEEAVEYLETFNIVVNS